MIDKMTIDNISNALQFRLEVKGIDIDHTYFDVEITENEKELIIKIGKEIQ